MVQAVFTINPLGPCARARGPQRSVRETEHVSVLIYMKGRELAIKSTTTRHHISHSHRPSSRLTSTRGEAHISRHFTHNMSRSARVAEALDAYPMAGAKGSQLSALLRPCSACRGSWSSPMQHLAASAVYGLWCASAVPQI